MSEQVVRFIGASVAHMPGSVIEQLLGMRRTIAAFNQARGLRTALLYTSGWFVQWHEGPAHAVEKTWAISRGHPGHSNPRQVHRSVGGGWLLEPVQIAALVGPDRATDVARRLFGIEQHQASAPIGPIEIWRHLSAPPSGRFAGAAPGGSPHGSIVVVSEHSESVELVKSIAERCGAPVSYQRFGGAAGHSDAGAAYVDIGSPGHRARVQALSRHALGFSLVRLLFAHLDAVILLRGGRAGAAALLSDAVAPFLAMFPQPPQQHVVEPGHNHADMVLGLIAGIRPASSTNAGAPP